MIFKIIYLNATKAKKLGDSQRLRVEAINEDCDH